jgi:hypothetical protein
LLMADEAVVLRDSEGTYYMLDKPTLEAARVPPGNVARLEEALAAEVTGYAFSLAGFAIAGVVAISPGGLSHQDRVHIDIIPHGDLGRP